MELVALGIAAGAFVLWLIKKTLGIRRTRGMHQRDSFGRLPDPPREVG